jgi:hypothetical protein
MRFDFYNGQAYSCCARYTRLIGPICSGEPVSIWEAFNPCAGLSSSGQHNLGFLQEINSSQQQEENTNESCVCVSKKHDKLPEIVGLDRNLGLCNCD